MSLCTLCPRACGVDRERSLGACRATARLTLSRAALHGGEEPCLSPRGKSGAVFFSGCALGCVFCQNDIISGADPFGVEVAEERFCEILLDLQEQGAENLDLVTGDHYVPQIASALRRVRSRLHIPVIFNCSGYETVEQLRLLEGLVDIYLPDFKFASDKLAARLCRAPDYPRVAREAIREMHRQVGDCVFDGEGKLLSGLVVRHLVLPNHTDNSLEVLSVLDSLFPDKSSVRLSLMRQFTPMPACREADLSRPLTSLEYRRVTECAEKLGFLGYVQERSSAGLEAIPLFDGTGVVG